MADENNNQNNNQNPPGEGTPPQNTDNQDSQSFDPSKLSDDQILKVLEDQRLWKSERLSKLNAKAKKAEEYESAESERKKKELEEKGEYQKLLEQEKNEKLQLQEQFKNERINNRIIAEALKAKVIDPDAAVALINKGDITVNENGEISGVTEAVAALVEAKPYLAGKGGNTNIGNPSNPSQESQSRLKFKASEINDPEFYQKHRKEIQEALALGQIEDDLPIQQ